MEYIEKEAKWKRLDSPPPKGPLIRARFLVGGSQGRGLVLEGVRSGVATMDTSICGFTGES